MATKLINRNWRQAFWAVGILVFLAELSLGVDYVQASLSNQIGGADMGWFAMLGMLTLKVANPAFWSDGAVFHLLARFVPLMLLPVLMLALWLVAARRSME